MIGKHQAYHQYKDSMVEWLGNIPNAWKIIRMDEIAFTVKEQVFPREIESELVTHYSIPVVQEIGVGKIEEGGTIDSNKFLVKEGDVLFSKLNPRKQTITTVLPHTKRVIASTEFIVLRTKPENQNYLNYLLHCPELKSFVCGKVESATKSHQRINPSVISKLKFALPSKEERQGIANFLDHETAKIDTLIEKQQLLIKLLKEKRQAVISHAVTKGLNPDAPMRDSGVEWLGEVPKHWKITRLKYNCSHIADCPHSTPAYDSDGEYPAIRTADISSGKLDIDNTRRVSKDVYIERNIRLVPQTGDIIYSREGERFGIGAIVPNGSKICLGQRVMLFRTNNTPEYFMWSLNAESTYKQAQQDVIGSTSPHVNVKTIKNFYLAWPSKNERKQISMYIDQFTNSLERIMSIAQTKIGLLHERRTALISAAVTGKIDVRNWQAPEQNSTNREDAS